MNIKRVKYKMSEEDSWEIGYIIGEYDGQSKTLLNSNFEYVPKIVDGNKEFLLYDFKEDYECILNITIPSK